ncbi:MAG: class I SAM-dependent methyltransferase [Planctomycetota bacterium]|nr:class I SAM-dependent methyltransferase [Planctomycetota bacterium]
MHLQKTTGTAVDPYYERGYHSKRHENLIADDEYFWARAEASARFYFTDDERSRRIFDYGCGMGQAFAKLPNARGWDISGEARQACRNRQLEVYDSIEDVPRKSWDIVFCRHALEHIEHPIDAIRTMRELIAENGELYLILPKERHYYGSMKPDINQHLYCWNFRAVNNLLHRTGFEPYANYYKYILGYRKLLPLRRVFGSGLYYYAAIIVGWLHRNGELVVRARLKP